MNKHSRLSCIYNNMKQRCLNPKTVNYKYYGGRGITVCDEWYTPHSQKGFKAFKEWALSNGYKDGLTIDRIDRNKGYYPENCRWVTVEVQNNNKGDNHIITYKGKTQNLMQWCKELNLSYERTASRLDTLNWDVKKAFETKDNIYGRQITYKGKTQNIKLWCKELGLSYSAVKHRLQRNWPVEKALEIKENPTYKMITYKNRTQRLSSWCKELGLNYRLILDRLNKLHWSVEKAFETKKQIQKGV